MKIFNNDIEGEFVSRPNRFIVYVKTEKEVIRAHCPNPGRLEEILIPGRRLILEKGRTTGRKTSHTLVGAYYKGKIIPLYSAKANKIAKDLVIPLIYPKAYKVLREQTWKSSRFDFLIIDNNAGKRVNTFLEVKACSLVEEGRAMFPDAPTKRGKKHIEELQRIVSEEKDYRGHILFIITHPDAKIFTPNIHTDPSFSISLRAASEQVIIDTVSIRCTSSGEVSLVNTRVPIDFKPVDYAVKGSGAYIIIMELSTAKNKTEQVKKGYYILTGEEDYSLAKIKQGNVKTFLIRSGKKIEGDMARDLGRIYGNPITLPSSFYGGFINILHSFYSKDNPMEQDSFLNIINYYRHTL